MLAAHHPKYGVPQILDLDGGVKMKYVDVGKNDDPQQQTVVMIHGMSQSSMNWGPGSCAGKWSNLVDPALELGRFITLPYRAH